MRSVLRGLAVVAGALFLLADGSPSEAERVIAAASAPFAPLAAYTFDVHVDVAMKSFPYLAFRLDGTGRWQRPDLYSIAFRHVPWFAKGFENAKIDPLQPQTWAHDYEFLGVAGTGERRTLSMREPAQPGNMKTIEADFDGDGLRRIDWEYRNGGAIVVEIDPVRVEGVPLPAVERTDLRLPGYHVLGVARFSNYTLIRTEPAQH